jgi:lambda family phage minor tail protein L
MTYVITATFSSEQAKQESSFPLDMYVVNASLTGADYTYYVNLNHDVVGFQLDADGDLTNTEQVYTGLPIARGSFESGINGEIPSLTISVPNTDRAMEAVIQANDYLRGCAIHLITGFADYLPSGATYAHIGTTKDKNAWMKERLFVDGVSTNEEAVTFNCKPKFTIKNVVIPRRKYARECQWLYGPASLASECRVAQSVYETYPTCNYTVASCQERVNATRFGGFPGIPRRGILIYG